MKINRKITTLALLLTLYCSQAAAGRANDTGTMSRKYIPAQFHNVELRLGFIGTRSNECTPFYDDFSTYSQNKLLINAPRKIVCDSPESLVIPLCGAYNITTKRGYKYANTPRMVHIRKEGDEVWYEGEVRDASDYYEDHIIFPPNHTARENQRQRMIQQAQKYTERKLDEDDSSSGGCFNLNVLDYVEIPFVEGIYEIYFSMSGLESNRVRVEIKKGREAADGRYATVGRSTSPSLPSPGIYAVGFEKNSHIYVAKQWHRGEVLTLTDINGHYGWANDVFVWDGDVYTVGYEYGERESRARLWKNGVPQRLGKAKRLERAHSVFVCEGDVYIAGSGYGQGETTAAILWKNGVPRLLTDGNGSSAAHSVYVTAEDVFVCGSMMNDRDNNVAILWHNSLVLELSDGAAHAEAVSVYVAGGDVYVAGGERNEQGRWNARLWKNGHPQELDSLVGNHFSYANSVFAYGEDVYVAGYEYNSTGRVVARLWKNGRAYDHTDGTPNAWAQSVFVSQGRVVVSGHGYNPQGKPVAILWENGVPYYITDGENRAEANGVFVR